MLFLPGSITAGLYVIAMGGCRNFSMKGQRRIVLIIFKLLTTQCKWTLRKRFMLSTPQG